MKIENPKDLPEKLSAKEARQVIAEHIEHQKQTIKDCSARAYQAKKRIAELEQVSLALTRIHTKPRGSRKDDLSI